MKDEDKTKEQLIAELEVLRKKVSEMKRDDTLHDSIKRTLSKSVETFRTLFNQAGDSIFLMEVKSNEGPIIVDANIAACAMHGYERHELIGKPIRLLDSPDTAKHVEERAKRLLTGEKLTFEGDHVRKDGTVFPVEVSAQLITIGGKSYILAIDRDITERKMAEAALMESEEKYRLLFEHANDSIFIIEPETRRFLDLNKNAADRLGYTREELLKLTIDDIDTPMAANRNQTTIQELMEKGHVLFEHAHRRKDGTEMPVEISSRVIEYGNQRVFQSFARDISRRKQAEAQLEVLNSELKRSNRELKAFAYLVSHDLHSPLLAVTKALKLLEQESKGRLEKKSIEYIVHAQDNISKMLKVIRNKLDNSTLQETDKEINPPVKNPV